MNNEIQQVEAVPVPRDLAMVTAQVADIGTETPVHEIAELRMFLEHLQRWSKQALGEMDQRMIAIIKETGREIAWSTDDRGNTRRFYVGQTKSVKCRDVQAALMFLLGLSIDDAMDCLSSGAFKHGAFAKLLKKVGQSEKFEELFETTFKPKLDQDGAEVPQLQSVDSKFLR